MALMSEERRREMEEEMSRFEQEIALPASPEVAPSPPAAPQVSQESKAETKQKPEVSAPGVTNIFPSEFCGKSIIHHHGLYKGKYVLCPPPPPPASPPPPRHLHPLPPPPPPPSALQPPPMIGAIRFIPPQLRQPPRPPMRHPFITMRMPMGFQHPVPIPFAPMHPHPPHMQHMAMGPIGVSLPMPPGFCPPGPPMQPMPNMNPVSEPYVPPVMPNAADDDETPENVSPDTQLEVPQDSESDFSHSAAPAVYAAPPMKSQSERMSESLHVRNGDMIIPTTTVSCVIPQTPDKPPVTKSVEETSANTTTQPVTNTEESNVSKKKEKKKKIVRMAGGQAWEDNSLMEWDPDDFRIFCGDLGNDVTDEVLIRAFSKYPSFVKAKVIRDKRTNKTKGYGFVSFKDPQDFIKAMREMNGRYVGSRPIKLRKSTWKDRNIEIVRKKQKEKEKLGLL